MKYISYTIYPEYYDPAPGRGMKPVQVGITFKPTPCLTEKELRDIIVQLTDIADEMQGERRVHLNWNEWATRQAIAHYRQFCRWPKMLGRAMTIEITHHKHGLCYVEDTDNFRPLFKTEVEYVVGNVRPNYPMPALNSDGQPMVNFLIMFSDDVYIDDYIQGLVDQGYFSEEGDD